MKILKKSSTIILKFCLWDYILILKYIIISDRYPLVEIATAAQTDEAQGALIAYLEFEYPPEAFLIERYLVALSISIHPTRKMLEDVLVIHNHNL